MMGRLEGKEVLFIVYLCSPIELINAKCPLFPGHTQCLAVIQSCFPQMTERVGNIRVMRCLDIKWPCYQSLIFPCISKEVST